MGTPAHNASFDVDVTPSFPLGGPCNVTWSNPATNPDHWRVYKQTFPAVPNTFDTPIWANSTDISGPLVGTTRSFNFTVGSDGSANYIWVVGFDLLELNANQILPIQFTGNDQTFTGTNTWTPATSDVCTVSTEDVPWTMDCQNGGQFRGQTTLTMSSLISGPAPGTATATAAGWGATGPPPASGGTGTTIVLLSGPVGGNFTIPYSESSIVNTQTVANTSVPLHIRSPRVNSPVGGGGSFNSATGTSYSANVSVRLNATYISALAHPNGGGAGFDGQGGFTGPSQGGGGNLAPGSPAPRRLQQGVQRLG